MKKEVNYIVYDKSTLRIVGTFNRWTKEVYKLVKIENNHWLNVSFPETKETLKEINKINKTKYE